MKDLKVAIVQTSPVYYDLSATMEKAAGLIQEASENAAQLVVFGETWFTGYPVWLDYYPNVALWDRRSTKQIFRRMHENALNVPGPETAVLCQWARSHGICLVAGCNERKNGTLYNSVIVITAAGELTLHHRKLMPTYTEKMIYGLGDGHGLQSVETSFGRLTAAICWEHWMPLTRQALHNQGEDLHVALWPKVHEMHQIASRQYAFEGRCFVIAAGQMLHQDQMPDTLRADYQPEEAWLLNGGSCVVRPDGYYDLEPQWDRDEVIYHVIADIGTVIEERMNLDVTGHYQRPDVFDFSVCSKRQNS